MKIKTGDNVIVIAGRDKGKTGKVAKVIREDNRVVVEGINIRKKHKKARTRDAQGQMIEMPMPIHASNVMLVEGESKKGVRAGYKMVNGKKVRISRKTENEI